MIFFQIRPGPDLAGFGIANPTGAGAECFFDLWAYVTQTAMSYKSKHHVDHHKFAIKLSRKVFILATFM